MDGAGLTCTINVNGATPTGEVCNGLDDDCNGTIDDGISCTPGCVPTSLIDLCNGLDDDCDGAFEENDPDVGQPCGSSNLSPCQFGTNACIGGSIVCIGEIEPGLEVCNGLDDTCDGEPDVDARPACVAGWGTGSSVFDMSGNLKEWTNDITGQSKGIDIAVQRGGSYATPSAGSTCEFRLTRAAVNVVEQETGFRRPTRRRRRSFQNVHHGRDAGGYSAGASARPH